MSDEKPRVIADVQQEYANLCAKVGGMHYQIFVLKQDIEMANKSLQDLASEGAKLYQEAQKASEAAKAAAPVSAPNLSIVPDEAPVSGAV